VKLGRYEIVRELGKGAMRGAVGSKLGDDAERFVEGNEHFLQNKAIMELA